MLFADVVATSAALGETRSRRTKIDTLARLLGELDVAEIVPVVAWLAGAPRQGRTGIGWRTLAAVRGEPAESATLTVGDVDRTLSDVVETTGSGSTMRRRELLAAVLGASTAAEQDFLFRLLTGDLRQGALEGVMTDAIANASGTPLATVRRAFMLSGRLPETAVVALADGAEGLAAIGLDVGRPVRPMLASPAESLAGAMADLGSAVSVEYKLDGARIQLHRNGDEVHVFTRTLREITATVPELVAFARELPCTAVVLDGETLALTDAGRPRPFQETMSRFGSGTAGTVGADDGQLRALLLRPYFFDCLHLDGVDLLDEPLSTRLDALDRVAGAHRIPALLRPDDAAAAAHFDAALAAGHEGIMVKSLDAPYAAGRRGRAWQKVKPEHTLDLVVLGAEWGYGRRTGFLSNLHLGARDPDGGAPIMVGKTFKGLTDQLLQWQTAEFPKHERERDARTVYLRPELVVEIELDGVQVSSRYPGGVALRFARVLRYRPDKTAAEADTIDAVRALLPEGIAVTATDG
ncbi:ATP-dependent DNA ligase [Aldersonia sp. NBC_00410]|uniref:ATP-dependent DNA ligase n=1 Tax=Aldersonia sp. NBC_00410 TaxID=2975954 RepID=UPI002256E632|nr:ATP-dependent DNA ligase [Aldersonia sp. NBC_00410]MCX5041857.1 ATP-dependent DNA ligase [Aldersonia sp. NBC_00410]